MTGRGWGGAAGGRARCSPRHVLHACLTPSPRLCPFFRRHVALLLTVFGAGFNLHMALQAAVFKSEGAIGVGLVNAVRGAVITVVISALFCTPARAALCLTRQSLASAAVTTLGGAVYVLASSGQRPAPRPVRKPPARKAAGAAGAAAAAAAQKDKEA